MNRNDDTDAFDEPEWRSDPFRALVSSAFLEAVAKHCDEWPTFYKQVLYDGIKCLLVFRQIIS